MWILWILYRMALKPWWEKLGNSVCWVDGCLSTPAPHPRELLVCLCPEITAALTGTLVMGVPGESGFVVLTCLNCSCYLPQQCLASTVRQLKPEEVVEARLEGESLLVIRNKVPRGWCEPAVYSTKSGSGLGFLLTWSDKIIFLFASHRVTLRPFRIWRNDLSKQCFFPQWYSLEICSPILIPAAVC